MALANDIKYGNYGRTTLFSLGQAGFVLKSKTGTVVAIDLYLSNCGERKYGFKRLMPMLLSPTDVIFDAVVCTHEHYDHFDIDAVPAMLANEKTQLVAAKDCQKLAERFEIPNEKTRFLGVGDSYQIKDIEVTAVFCDHGSETPDAIGLVIQIDGRKIYMAGDTCLRLDMVEEIRKYTGKPDIMIAPINGAFGNLNEAEMVQLCGEVAPKLVIPCHYWNFAEHGGNPGLFAEIIKREMPGQKYRLMCLGEGMDVEEAIG